MPRIPVINTSHLDRIDELLVDDFESGEFKLHRSVFTDQALFDLEMKYIFEGNWVYLAHESQIPNKNDYYTTYMGRLLRGDFGTSTMTNRPVVEEFADRFPATLELSIFAIVFAVVIGIPLGYWAARHVGRWQDDVAVVGVDHVLDDRAELAARAAHGARRARTRRR